MIYLIVTDDNKYCRIGYASNPEVTLQTLQADYPTKLHLAKTIVGNMAEATALHELFNSFRASGPWYVLNEKITSHFKLNEAGFMREFLSRENKNILHKYNLNTDILADYFEFASPQSFRSSTAYRRYMDGVTKLIRHIQRELLDKIS